MISPRLFNLAVRNLNYTHTEAGFRTVAQITAELNDMMELTSKRAGTSSGMPEDFGDDGEGDE